MSHASAVFLQEALTIGRSTATRASTPGGFSFRAAAVFAHSGDEIEVILGSLDAPDQLTATYKSWIIRRES